MPRGKGIGSMDQRYVQREPRAWTEHYLVLGWHRGVPAIARAIIATAGIAAPVVFVNVGDTDAMVGEAPAQVTAMLIVPVPVASRASEVW